MTDRAPRRPLIKHLLWRSLRFRWAMLNTLMVLSVALAALYALREVARSARITEVDTILLNDLDEILLAFQTGRPVDWQTLKTELRHEALGHEERHWTATFFDVAGHPTWTTPGAQLQLPSPTKSTEARMHTTRGIRYVWKPTPNSTGEVASVAIGVKIDYISGMLARFDRWGLVAIGGLMIVAPLLGYWSASRAAQTVGEITDLASRMQADGLHERLPIHGNGDELDRLSETINGFLDRIAADAQLKRDFLANAAHELRTPLAAIRSSVEVALSADRPNEMYRDLLADILEENAHQTGLVNQLLLLSENEAHRAHTGWANVELNRLVERSVEMFRGVTEEREQALVVKRLDTANVEGNIDHLRQVVNNLLVNAIRYTPLRGAVEVALEANTSANLARLAISDNGPGIHPEDLPQIFTRFFRSQRTRQAVRGSGIGLSLCKSVVETHGGRIECQSEFGHGTTMTVELPLAKEERAQSPAVR